MSFNKRFYSWERIIDFIKSNEFSTFDRWFLGPDAHIFEDETSSDFFKAYLSIDEDLRQILFECVKNEDDDFYTELIKCINVKSNPDNNLLHENTVESYVSLFINKWGEKPEEYKYLIIK